MNLSPRPDAPPTIPGMKRCAATLVLGGALLLGCGSSSLALPAACLGNADAFRQALTAAPASVRLAGGTPISRCVDRAGDRLQDVSSNLTPVADALAAQAVRDPAAAVRLGYLIGAVRRGAAHTAGIAAELTRRIELAGSLPGAAPAALAALQRGIAAGSAGG